MVWNLYCNPFFENYLCIPDEARTRDSRLKRAMLYLLSYGDVRLMGLEPTNLAAPDPKSDVFTYFTTDASKENGFRRFYPYFIYLESDLKTK